MSRSDRGELIAPGVHRDAFGYSAIVYVKRKAYEKRFPANEELATIQLWQADERAYRLRCAQDDQAQTDRPVRGTLASAALAYLKTREGRTGYAADASHLQAWIAKHGKWSLAKIGKPQAQLAFADWREQGISERTIRHRRRVLRELYRATYGPYARTPVDGIKMPGLQRAAPIAVSAKVIRDVAHRLRTSATLEHQQHYARFLVLATTGQRPAQLMRALPGDVHFGHKPVWYVRPAKGGDAAPLPLDRGMVAAWKVFVQADAWGTYDTGNFAKRLRTHGWPDGVRPYQLRHTFAIDLLTKGVDLGDVQGLLGHRQIQTTRDHYGPIQLLRLRQAVGRRTLKLER